MAKVDRTPQPGEAYTVTCPVCGEKATVAYRTRPENDTVICVKCEQEAK